MNFHWMLPSTTLILNLNTIPSIRTSKKYFVSSPPILEQTLSSDFECSSSVSYTFLHPSSVLERPQYFTFIHFIKILVHYIFLNNRVNYKVGLYPLHHISILSLTLIWLIWFLTFTMSC